MHVCGHVLQSSTKEWAIVSQTRLCGQDAGSRNLGPFLLRNSVFILTFPRRANIRNQFFLRLWNVGVPGNAYEMRYQSDNKEVRRRIADCTYVHNFFPVLWYWAKVTIQPYSVSIDLLIIILMSRGCGLITISFLSCCSTYRLVQKRGTVLLSTSLAWLAVAGCSRAESFSRLSPISFAQPCNWCSFESSSVSYDIRVIPVSS